ncbi:MAG: DNA polymerase III subunit delta [Actinobacteria bacterium]|nr:DNA polymerase III subunit delta [Actinomycetota bacterium]
MTNLPKLTLITGTTDLLVDRALEKVWSALKTNIKDISKQEIDATSEDAYIEFADAMSPNLFGSSYLVIVDHINVAEDKLDEKLVEALKNAESNISEENYLVVIHRGGAGGTGIVKALQKQKVAEIKCETIKDPHEYLDFMRLEFKRNKKTIDEDALLALRDAVGEELDELSGAINQLCFDVLEDKITLESVKKYYQGNAAVKVFDITNALFNADPHSALEKLNDLLEQDSNSFVYIVSVLAGSLRKLVKLAGLPTSASDFQIAQELGINPKQVKYLKSQLRNWTPTSLANAVVELAKVDALVRAGFDGIYLDNNQKRFLLETTIQKIGASAR